MRFLTLGQVGVSTSQGIVPVPGRRRAMLLTALLAADRAVVGEEELAFSLWGNTPPPKWQGALRAQVARLRELLEELEPAGPGRNRLITHSPGYRLDAAPHETDFGVFLYEVTTVGENASADPRRAAERLEAALNLWRGPLVVNHLPESPSFLLARRLSEARARALCDLAAARIQAGDHARALADLSSTAVEYPFDERFPSLQMDALARMGRAAEALDVYTRTRERLVDELGVEPGPVLQQRLTDVLRGNRIREEESYPVLDTRAGPRFTPNPEPQSSAAILVTSDQHGGSLPRAVVGQLFDRDSFVEFHHDGPGMLFGEENVHVLPTVAGGLARSGGRPIVAFIEECRPSSKSPEMAIRRIALTLGHLARRRRIPVVFVRLAEPDSSAELPSWEMESSADAAASSLSGHVPRVRVVIQSGGPDMPRVEMAEDLLITANQVNDACILLRKVLSYLPSSCRSAPPITLTRAVDPEKDLGDAALQKAFGVVDAGSWMPVGNTGSRPHVGFARINGRPIGVIVWNPGSREADQCSEDRPFVRFCDAFGLPLVVVAPRSPAGTRPSERNVDFAPVVPSFASALADAVVPRVTVLGDKPPQGWGRDIDVLMMCSDIVLTCPPIAPKQSLGEPSPDTWVRSRICTILQALSENAEYHFRHDTLPLVDRSPAKSRARRSVQ